MQTVKSKSVQRKKSAGKLGLKFIPDCKLADLKLYDRNPRLNDAAVEAVSKSIAAFGFIAPIIIDEDYQICAGHTRYKAAIHLRLKTVPVVLVPGLNGDKFAGYNIADNRTGQIAAWNQDELAKIVHDLKSHDFDLSSLGLSDDEIKDLLSNLDGAGFDPATLDQQGKLDQRTPVKCPNCGHQFEVRG